MQGRNGRKTIAFRTCIWKSSCHGDGLYPKREGKLYDGSGLLLGPNSPFKNIPILGLLLEKICVLFKK